MYYIKNMSIFKNFVKKILLISILFFLIKNWGHLPYLNLRNFTLMTFLCLGVLLKGIKAVKSGQINLTTGSKFGRMSELHSGKSAVYWGYIHVLLGLFVFLAYLAIISDFLYSGKFNLRLLQIYLLRK